MIKVIPGQLYSTNFSKLEQLSSDYSSCVRYCYNQFKRNNLKFNDVRKLAKTKYTSLNTRQISDACLQGQAIFTKNKDKKVIFGGKSLWKKLKSKIITKQQWKNQRDYKLYARGDATKSGNPNLRIVDNQLRVITGFRKYEYYKLFIPKKFKQQLDNLLASGKSYNIRLKKQDDTHWQVWIDYNYQEPKITTNFNDGAIGIDINPDRLAISNITEDGNLIESFSLIESRLQHGSTNKRNYDIGCLVKQIIAYAIEKNKGIVFEDLKFKREYKQFETKWNRIKSNFTWRKILNSLERKCIEHGIEYKKINPAYTSVIGKVKYQQLYKLTIHEAASFVIARRGLGFNEKLSVNKVSAKLVKEKLIRTLAGKYNKKRIHSWVLWRQMKAVLTGLRKDMQNLKEFCDKLINSLLIDYFRNDSVNLSSKTFLQELIVGSNRDSIQEKERSPSKLLQVW